ncbi:MAG: rhodanese-like domain-containing protein [Limnobacter sp.]|nr:rhodanese-like domain-containing protein [Limnobacter sp.]
MTQEFLLENSWLIALALGSGLMLIIPALNGGGVKRATVAQTTLLMNQKKAVLLDVRDEDLAQKMGFLGGAKRVPVSDLEAKVPSLVKSKETPIVVACQMGQTSKSAAKTLQKLGYTEVYSMDGGANAWMDAGMPIKKQTPADSTSKSKKSKAA